MASSCWRAAILAREPEALSQAKLPKASSVARSRVTTFIVLLWLRLHTRCGDLHLRQQVGLVFIHAQLLAGAKLLHVFCRLLDRGANAEEENED